MDKKEKDWKNLKNLVVDRDKTGEWTLEGCIDEEGMNTLISFIEAREDRAREEMFTPEEFSLIHSAMVDYTLEHWGEKDGRASVFLKIREKLDKLTI